MIEVNNNIYLDDWFKCVADHKDKTEQDSERYHR